MEELGELINQGLIEEAVLDLIEEKQDRPSSWTSSPDHCYPRRRPRPAPGIAVRKPVRDGLSPNAHKLAAENLLGRREGAACRSRASGRVPAVLYGHGTSSAT